MTNVEKFYRKAKKEFDLIEEIRVDIGYSSWYKTLKYSVYVQLKTGHSFSTGVCSSMDEAIKKAKKELDESL